MKTALITGAASGIGLALTKVCLEKDFTVVMVDINAEKLKETAQELNQQFPKRIFEKVCDITNADAVNQLAQEVFHDLKQLDWLFNNAGIIGHLAPIWELKSEQVQEVFAVNVLGMTHVIQAFMPFFLQQKSAHIINMASLYGVCTSSQVAPYTMSKHAVLALSESLYFDLQRLEKPINVSIVFPSFTDTALLQSNNPSSFKHSLNSFMAHSKPALELAHQIINDVEQKKFYIFPDKEVKVYAKERIESMLNQEQPKINAVEQLMGSLIRRNEKNRNKTRH